MSEASTGAAPLETLTTDVVIVGAGPAGLMLAIELGCRGVRCVVLEEDADEAVPPKANATSSRTMEHYRRRGFAAAVRSSGLPAEHPQDVLYVTRLGGTPLARFAIPSRADAALRRDFGDLGEAAWPTPELPHRGNQMYIEPILRREARRYPSVGLRFSTRATALRDLGDRVEVSAETKSGKALRVGARHAVGCDGPRSVVREAMGVAYLGLGAEKRDFFGGQMLGIHFRSPDLHEALGRRGWTTWLFNPEQRGVLVSIDGVERYIFGLQLRPGQTPDEVDVKRLFELVCKRPFAFQVLDRSTWTAGHMLVAERFSAGRLHLAGDAAHLFTPTGGMGYNTSVDDAVNLGWKLAAVCQGWAPEALLASYGDERRPIAERNTAFARAMAESIGRLQIPADLEAPGAAGDAVRKAFGERLRAHAQAEFNVPGIQLGLRYGGALIAREAGEPPPDERNRYVPSAWPGARAPHVALSGGGSNLDRYGRDFTLLDFTDADASGWHGAAAALGMPLQTLRWPDPKTLNAARALHGADRVLIRPDHHVAWRGDAGVASAADAMAVLAGAIGAQPRPRSQP